MTVTIEDKIELFRKMIYGNIEAQSSQRRQVLTEAHEKELQQFEAEVEKKKGELQAAASAKAERERTKLLAQAANHQHQMLIAQQHEIFEKVMKRMQEKATAFASTEPYIAYLQKNIQLAQRAMGGASKLTYYVLEKDMEFFHAQMQEHKEVEIKPGPGNMIGGFIVEDRENLLQMDLTLKSLLEENKEGIGAEITRRFNEVSTYGQ